MLEEMESSPIYKTYITIIKHQVIEARTLMTAKIRYQAVLIQLHNRMPQSDFDCDQFSRQKSCQTLWLSKELFNF